MAIQFACPYCETISSVPDSFAGKQGKCPACQKVIEVPDPKAFEDDPRDVQRDPPKQPPVSPPPAGDTKTCKFCGETIKAVAKKCKFCGEFFDKSAAPRQGRVDGERRRRAEQSPTTLDYLLSVFCSFIACIVAVIYLIQGYHKRGLIMIAVTFVAQILWAIVRVVLVELR